MRPGGQPSPDAVNVTAEIRRRPVPTRYMIEKVIVARPGDGAPVVLASTAAFVWRLLENWTTPEAIDLRMTDAFPEVRHDERLDARSEILRTLGDDDLVERR